MRAESRGYEPIRVTFDDFEIDDDLTRIDFARVHEWLAATYWSPGIERRKVEQAARMSTLVIGAYRNEEQVGYARVVSDTVRFAYLADVYVDAAYRGYGLGRAIVRFAMEHPLLAEARSMLLATHDAHGVYAALGFEPLAHPEHWMRWRRDPD